MIQQGGKIDIEQQVYFRGDLFQLKIPFDAEGNRRAKRVAEGVEFICGGIGKDSPTESKRLEVCYRSALGERR